MLPPESTQAIFLPLTSTLLLRTAASGVAPAGSTTCFVLSRSSKIASEISASDTVTTSSAYLLISSTVLSPGILTAIPSAIVTAESVVTCFFSLNEL